MAPRVRAEGKVFVVFAYLFLSPFLLAVEVAIVNVDPLATARPDGAATAQ